MFLFNLSKVTTVVLTDNKPFIKYDPLGWKYGTKYPRHEDLSNIVYIQQLIINL